MNAKPSHAHILTFALCITMASTAIAQKHYHVVIGAFAIKSNAEKFTGYVRTARYNAGYDQHLKSKLYYVYVLKTLDHDRAFAQTKQLQQESEFKDAWVYHGTLTSIAPPVQVIPERPLVMDEKDTVAVEEPEVIADLPDSTLSAAGDSIASMTSDSVATPAKKVRGKLFKFVIQTEDGTSLPAEVHHVDYSRGRDIASYRTGEPVDVLPPSSANNPMTVVCGVFGYKEVVKVIDYRNPEVTDGVTKDESGAWVIPYPMERMESGDVSVMYHVAFYKDAVIMLPVSKRELDELANMMAANPNYKIKIHGHCNGTHNRRIIALGETKNYFDINGSNEIEGSAKELSRLRADAVRSYLEEQGIDEDRMDIQAWGASNMLVSETSTSAKLNDRIEIEILKH